MIDLSHWKLTLPVNGAAEVSPADLVAGYQSQYFSSFGDSLVFCCPVNGDTTPNAKYPRSELREMIDPNDDNINWRIGEGRHALSMSASVDVPPSSGKVIIAQVHSSNRPLLKVQWEDGKVYGLFKKSPRGSDDVKVFAAYMPLYTETKIGITIDSFSASLHVGGESMVAVWSDLDTDWLAEEFYFKAGCYPQDNRGREIAQVSIQELSASHFEVDNEIELRLDAIEEKIDRISEYLDYIQSYR